MKYGKLTPGVLSVLEDHRTLGNRGLTQHMKSLGIVPGQAQGQPRLIVFLHCDAKEPLTRLAKFGITVNQTTGRVRTAIVPLDGLDALSDDDAVERVEASRVLRPLDLASTKVNVPAFQARFPTPFTGQGVVVGVVDSGIDSAHAAFAGRIDRIWDQTLSGPGVAEGNYGREVRGAQLPASVDSNGHGTHVAGIAAGAHPTFTGVAPGATLVAVKTDFNTAHIADAVRYVFRVAREVHKPAVVNLSLGGHFDAHDGTDDLSAIIDQESGPGQIVCCAAGNEGNDNIHGQLLVPPATTKTARFLIPASFQGVALVNVWYPGAASLEFAVQAPNGLSTAFQSIIANGNYRRTYSIPGGGSVAISTPPPDPANNDHNVLVEVRATGGGPSNVWRLVARNAQATTVTVQAWTLDGEEAPVVVFTGTTAVDSMKIGSPGTAASAVTVGSFTTRVQWVDAGSTTQAVHLVLDDISDFSSKGPLRNGAAKPDLVAPGAMIVSCLSATSLVDPAFVVTAGMRVNAGTSMATPFVTGIVALLLQRVPTLDPVGIKQALRANCSIPNLPGGAFDPKWGGGLLDATNL